MTADQFRTIALSFPEAVEAQHMGHPDFRVDGKIFATLGPQGDWAMAKLTPDQQAAFQAAHPDVFTPASGAWGKRGATIIRLADVKQATARKSLIAAWRNAAPKRLID
jgi:hypothetical protein